MRLEAAVWRLRRLPLPHLACPTLLAAAWALAWPSPSSSIHRWQSRFCVVTRQQLTLSHCHLHCTRLQCLERYLPQANGRMNRSSVCMFTNSTDGHFLLDFHPKYGSTVVLSSACSGEVPPVGNVLHC